MERVLRSVIIFSSIFAIISGEMVFAEYTVLIPGGESEMGDHYDLGGLEHQSDEVPIHTVYVDSFYMGITEVTNQQYCDYLNSALSQSAIEVRDGLVYAAGGSDIYCETNQAVSYSRISWNGSTFSVLDNKENHPMVCVRWHGAAAYCNWLSSQNGHQQLYDLSAGDCNLSDDGYRLPTEAEWEYAARGGRYYYIFPWGNNENEDGTYANWPGSGDPYETGSYPYTTPAGFYNGQLHHKADFNWPDSQTSYQTSDGSNGYGLYDMSGNVWEWCNDLYNRDYYSVSPYDNPQGPASGTLMPDGNPYHVLRGGNWYNGEQYWGHGRVANRNPAYYRGPDDPNHAWYHVGFRIIRKTGSGSIIAPEATLVELSDEFEFTEGPAADAEGNVFFSDLSTSIIYKWSIDGQLSVFRENSGGANGLFFDRQGNLLACEGNNQRLVSIDQKGNVTVLADEYNSTPFNQTNDLWIDSNGGIYFSDPAYGVPVVQDGEHVYYLTPDHNDVIRVIDDMVRPNGIIGTPDGQTLYVTDHGSGQTYRYDINSDGTLSNKTLFVSVGSDGMTIDDEGNIYMTENSVLVYDPSGSLIEEIVVPEQPTNVAFGGSDGHTLFITARTSFYSIRTRVKGVWSPTITGTTHIPTVPWETNPVWVTTVVVDDGRVENVTLIYDSNSATESTVFLETMRTEPSKPWTGDGCNYSWTVTAAIPDNVEQRTQANYGGGNPCGVEFRVCTNNLTDTMIEPTNGIDATGTSGYAEFWLWADGLDGTDGWTFQLDSGSGYITRLSELTGSNHDWQLYHYDLLPGELVSNLKIRFQFRGGDTGNRIHLDYISVNVTSASGFVDVTMYDDGTHEDGIAGDNLYGAWIPAFPENTVVEYYVTATDDAGMTSTDPSAAPDIIYSYSVAESPPEQTVGLFINDEQAYNGYTLFAPKHNTITYLIDNNGRETHSWQSDYEPGQSVYLLENGDLLHTCFIKGTAIAGGGEGGRIEKFDWDGNLIWEFDYSTDQYLSHHDIEPLPNGNILVLAIEKKTYEECIDAGFDPGKMSPDIASEGYMLPDYVIEVEPTPSIGGNIIWEWHVWDHLIQDYDPTKNNYGVVADHPELVNANGPGNVIAQFWNHMNSIDYNAELDQIILSVRGNSELWVIDHNTTTAEAAGHTGGRYNKGGDLLYRWGNPQSYDAGDAGDQMLFQQHDAQWIESGCPGSGNMLIYNNGLGRNHSSVDEIIPPVDVNGYYPLTPGSAYEPETLEWTYHADPPEDLYSEAISGAQRLPNGNTLICDGTHGTFLEVTPAGEIIWKYINPVINTGILAQGEVPPLDNRGHQYNAVFKIHRYAPEYPGLAGKDLTPGEPIELCYALIYSGNIDGDCDVDISDLALLAGQWLETNCGQCYGADLTGDWNVDFTDFTIFANNWLAGK